MRRGNAQSDSVVPDSLQAPPHGAFSIRIILAFCKKLERINIVFSYASVLQNTSIRTVDENRKPTEPKRGGFSSAIGLVGGCALEGHEIAAAVEHDVHHAQVGDARIDEAVLVGGLPDRGADEIAQRLPFAEPGCLLHRYALGDDVVLLPARLLEPRVELILRRVRFDGPHACVCTGRLLVGQDDDVLGVGDFLEPTPAVAVGEAPEGLAFAGDFLVRRRIHETCEGPIRVVEGGVGVAASGEFPHRGLRRVTLDFDGLGLHWTSPSSVPEIGEKFCGLN